MPKESVTLCARLAFPRARPSPRPAPRDSPARSRGRCLLGQSRDWLFSGFASRLVHRAPTNDCDSRNERRCCDGIPMNLQPGARVRATFSWEACVTTASPSANRTVPTDFDLFLYNRTRDEGLYASQTDEDVNEGFDVTIPGMERRLRSASGVAGREQRLQRQRAATERGRYVFFTRGSETWGSRSSRTAPRRRSAPSRSRLNHVEYRSHAARSAAQKEVPLSANEWRMTVS
jgi:hypothetical protein